MKRKRIGLSVVLMTIVAIAGLVGCTSSPAPTTTTTLPPTTATTTPPTTTTSPPATTTTPPTTTPPVSAIPPEISQYAADWPLANKDYSNTRATTDSTINSSNVGTLGVAWSVPLMNGSVFGSAATNPIIQGNTIYFQDLGLNVFAVDRTTGQIKWSHLYNTPDIGPCGPAVGYGKVFVPLDPYSVAALDASTGEQLWAKDISVQPSIGIDFQPTLYDGKLFVSTVPGVSALDFYAGGAYGTFFALDQQNGSVIWKWDTVDDPSSMWGNAAVNSGGGSWFPPAVDTQTGMTYWGVANPAPLAGTQEYPNGSSRPGPNLYTNAAVALDQSTGNLKWFNQVWPHGINDYDLQQSPVLATANINGQQQDVVIASGKMGRVYCFNRETGALLWQASVGKHENDLQIAHNPPAGQDSVEVFPGIYGGVETPIAYADGVVYAAANNVGTSYTPSTLVPAGQDTGTGNLVAIDVNYGRWLWSVDLPAATYGGATVVNDLVFTATVDGTIYAFKRDTGEQVWTYKAPAGIIAWPAVAGDMIVWPCGSGAAPSLIALKLGVTAPVLEIARPLGNTTVPAGDVTATTAVFNFSPVDKLGLTAVPGEGHLHYFLDYDAPTTQGQPAVPPSGSNVSWTPSPATSYTFKNVAPGDHFISVELVNNDHTPLNPPVVEKISFTVQANVPSVQISSPASRSTEQPGSITITVKLTNFTLTTESGLPNAPNQGKIIFYMDDTLPDVPGQSATTATSVTSSGTTYTWTMGGGTHIFGVQLVNNDLTTLAIPATAEIVIYTGQAPGTGP